ncbi:MAG: hypothetical protein QXS74_06310 [Nitrososphaeria archaeon]
MNTDILILFAKILERTKKLKKDINTLPIVNNDVAENFYNAIAREIYEIEEILQKKGCKEIHQGSIKSSERK